jgi:sterol 3beta-glucosyltransferase
MNIFIATYGSRGDVQPYVALGKGLQESGHQVTLATSDRFRVFVGEHDLQYGYMNDDLLAIVDTDQGRDLLPKG